MEITIQRPRKQIISYKAGIFKKRLLKGQLIYNAWTRGGSSWTGPFLSCIFAMMGHLQTSQVLLS